MMKLAQVTLLALIATVVSQVEDGSDIVYNNCAVDDFYVALPVDPTAWSRAEVRDLITTQHRTVLKNVNPVQGGDDILLALVDLDPGTVPGETVHEVYRDISLPATPAGNPNTWKRGDLWPVDRGAAYDTPALTDVHSKRPADSTVLIKKEDLFFGMCGTVESEDTCSRPATNETAEDTEQDNKIFAPPMNARGSIARALFYTALRYELDLGLELTDCPPFADTQFGYLSELLRWHQEYPVTEEEVTRNMRACGRWQGNRNPFVDFPDLVETFFGSPDTILEGTFKYNRCLAATESPTATPNECSALAAGDLPIFVVNSDHPDQVVFFPLTDIPAAVGSIYVTDNAWNGTAFSNMEGTMEFTIPKKGLQAGESFGCGDGSPFAENCTSADVAKESRDASDANLFDISISGDQLLVYCINADNKPHFLWGFSYNGNWSEAGLTFEEYGTDKSALPEELAVNGNVVLPHKDNCLYQGVMTGKKTVLQESFLDPASYVCDDQSRYQFESESGAVAHVLSAAVMAMVVAVAMPVLN